MITPKILIIGAGAVGSSCAAFMAQKQLGSIYLYDAVEDLAIGRAMDFNQASPYLGTDTKVVGCNSMSDLKDMDIVVITAGAARKAGMTRFDLLQRNIAVMDEIGEVIVKNNPTAKVLVITNPVDILTWYVKKKWPAMNVFGLGCALDTMRFRYFIAEAVGGSIDCARGIVIGVHNETMVPLVGHATVGGVPIRHILTSETIEDIIHRTRTAGTAITHKLKNHSGYYAAAYVGTQITESIVMNRFATFPLSVYCIGEYGYHDICLSLPSVVGQEGIKRVLEIELEHYERKALENCVNEITGAVSDIDLLN